MGFQATSTPAGSESGVVDFAGYWSIGSAELATWSNTPLLDGSGVSYFNGSLAGLAVLPTALSAAAVSSIYDASSFSA